MDLKGVIKLFKDTDFFLLPPKKDITLFKGYALERGLNKHVGTISRAMHL